MRGEERGGGAGASGGSTNSEDGARGKKRECTNERTRVSIISSLNVCIASSS